MNTSKTLVAFARLLPLIALALGVPTPAAGGWYKIELLVFLNPAPGEGAGEVAPALPLSADTVPLQLPRDPDAAYALLPKSALELNAHRLQLNRSGRYESLLHLAWRQPVTDERHADTLTLELPSGAGTLRMSRGRFLHADLDVRYQPPQPPAPMAATVPGSGYSGFNQPKVYRLNVKRRMRRDELHYLDSPGLGALIIAHRYQRQGETVDDDAADEQAAPAVEQEGGKAAMEPN
jgi:hypothetical protein